MRVPDPTEEAFAARLAEIDRLGRRDYPEIGVPMVLVTEDLTRSDAPPVPDDGTGRVLALLLADAIEAMRRRKPDLDAGDIARLIEVLADRHLMGLATPAFSLDPDLHPEPEAP